MSTYEVVVVGGGHAGVEAAWAASSVLGSGGRVALITMDASRLGVMSCNPAIGGLAKGQMVREIDALGGVMGLATDATGILFKVLNSSKGPAVRGPRAQCDKEAYAAEVQRILATRAARIDVICATVEDLIVESRVLKGALLSHDACVVQASPKRIDSNVAGACLALPAYPSAVEVAGGARKQSLGNGTGKPVRIDCQTLILTTGTFMRALMHTGEQRTAGGRIGEGSALGIAGSLRRLGFELGRLKTGTPPRLARASIDWDSLPQQHGDESPQPFSDMTPELTLRGKFPSLPQISCRETATNSHIHGVIMANLHRAPMFSGQVEAECGPRYCPSIEDKVVRFSQRDSHHVFLEPESLHTDDIYCNGISTSLPAEVQVEIVHAMPGCERAEIKRFGYAVEYDMVWPHQIDSTGRTKLVDGLYLAGQINGTSGYEEAAAQGLVAGLNAAREVLGKDPVRLGREQAYIGVLMDDLVVRTPREPYRMFTSRAEHRLLLRADNADERLTTLGWQWGLVDPRRHQAWLARAGELEIARAAIAADPHKTGALRRECVRHDASPQELVAAFSQSGIEVKPTIASRASTDYRYEPYIIRARAEARRVAESERMPIPVQLDPAGICGLRTEAVEALQRFRPATLAQAGRLAGVHPADLSIIAIALKRHRAANIADASPP
ncbi:MAG: tRNA uridine-5-carboxymethylaminomethyl(34) synthesis enzyme MnmG [Phycisphaerales bacterium]|nr:tRNA uridine-5-carboxymethylaminomethyl(34) synthesis enzyme MnmG [Phycisphaerales bacterium]